MGTRLGIQILGEIRWDEKAGLRTDAVYATQVINVLKAQEIQEADSEKGSTTLARQSGNIPQQKLTIGLDLGDRSGWYDVVDEAGQIELEQRALRLRKRCAKPSAGCRAARSRWRPGHIHPGSAAS